jgi:hypothetical protein
VHTGFWWGKLKERGHSANPDVLEDNIKMVLQELGLGDKDGIDLAQAKDRWPRLVKVLINLRVPYNVGNLLISLKPVSFSRRTLFP